MKFATIIGSTLMALFLASGNVMAEEDGDKVRTRTEAAERVNLQDEGEQKREQVRNRYEDGEGEQQKHQYKHQYKHQGATGSRTAAGSRR